MLIHTKFNPGDKAKMHTSPVLIKEVFINGHDSDKHHAIEIDYIIQLENGRIDRVYESELKGLDE